MIANIVPKLEDDKGYVLANIHNQPNAVDENGYAMMVISHDKMAKDRKGYLTIKANQKKGIYVNDTDYCTVGNPSAGSPDSNGKNII